jgi:hypothetical protein
MLSCPGAAQREALSAFTRVFDALWRNGALQTPISGLPEIGAHMRKSGKPDLRGSLRSVAVPDQRCSASLRSRCIASGTHNSLGRVRPPYSPCQTALLVPATRFCARALRLCFTRLREASAGK